MMGAMDNLVKGAAGQAVQNMNLMFGFEEAEGLRTWLRSSRKYRKGTENDNGNPGNDKRKITINYMSCG